MSIEGIPNGWKLVRVGKCYPGEVRVDSEGKPAEWIQPPSMSANYVIIRKIEKPKRYRPFANAAELDELWNAVLKFKNPEQGLEDSRYRIVCITADWVGIGHGSYSYKDAFEVFEVFDGTPFGVEVTE